MSTLRFESDSLEATEEFMSRAYAPMRIGGRPYGAHTLVERTTAPGVSVDKLDLDYTMAYDAGVLDKVALLTIHAGTLTDTTGGRHEVYGPGESFLVTRPDRPYSGEVQAARYTVTMFDPSVLTEVAATGAGGGRGPVELTGHRAISPAAGRRLGAAIGYLRDHVLTDPQAGGLVVATAVRHLAAVTLASLPNTTMAEEEHRLDSRDAGTDTLRRAMAYIEDNAHRDISLADIAAAAFVTPRAAQYAFRRHASTTPLGYLRRVRLDRAHADLRAADPRTASVSAVAMSWGFVHQGRFAAAYRTAYGVPPSATLHGTER
ncbi:AraC family transcriptional regulator [Streptomyces solincola]|uniref:AraC family transcriptional regulator n=1 Tax=Streptomyces solincola TaxID=2100817 RepID=A0A2S9Q184_9ACTN|nr:helix-turn-helix transcriptional regulator [Streptomyces solincola]PRH80440.1 AraC family transcriptional regulator [Streptomyces solincola]